MKSSPLSPASRDSFPSPSKLERGVTNKVSDGVRWVLIGLLVLFVIFSWPADPFNLATVDVVIPPGASAKDIQRILKSNRILPSFSSFRLLVKLFNLPNRMKAGEYSFSPSDPLFKVIWKLTEGVVAPQRQIRVTFPEGASIYRMGMILKDNGFADWKKFQSLVDEGIKADLRERHWNIFKYISSESLEGYLFPDTYMFLPQASAEAAAEVMLNRFTEMVLPFWEKSRRDTNLSLHEILTMASIVEKEARKPAERPIIASVFYNRLKAGMPLAADPTVKYALERPTKVVYLDQLAVKSPYNTYKRRGLPPGPICNPGLDSIKAAIYPAKTNYFFFVARSDGSHSFSKTWQEHQRARIKSK